MSRPSPPLLAPLLAALACAAAILLPQAASAGGYGRPAFAEFGYGEYVYGEYYVSHDLGAFGWNVPLLAGAVYNHPEPPYYPYYRARRHGWSYHRRPRHVAAVVRGCPCHPAMHRSRHRHD